MEDQNVAVAEQEFEQMTPSLVALRQTAEAVMSKLKFPDKDGYLALDTTLSKVHAALVAAETNRKKFTTPLNKVVDDINAVAKRTTVPLAALKETIRIKMAEYAREEILAKRKEDERIALENRKRIEEERLAAAVKAEEAKDTKLADAILNKPVVVPKSTITTANQESKSNVKMVWKAHVFDRAMFLRACADDRMGVLEDFVSIEQGELNAHAQATKGQSPIPGIEFREEAQIQSR